MEWGRRCFPICPYTGLAQQDGLHGPDGLARLLLSVFRHRCTASASSQLPNRQLSSALAFHGLSDVLPETVHLTVPVGFRKPPPPGVVLHRGEVTDEERQTEHGFQVTTVLWTLRDLKGSEVVEQTIQAALEQGRISPAQRARLEQDCP